MVQASLPLQAKAIVIHTTTINSVPHAFRDDGPVFNSGTPYNKTKM